MFLFKVKHLIWSALEIKFFELYFLQSVLGGHLVLSGHLAIPQGWPPNQYQFHCIIFAIKLRAKGRKPRKKG